MQAEPISGGAIFDRTVLAAEGIARLPAVPTLDWADRLARCLVPLSRGGAALVLVGTIDATGAIATSEAVGVALSDADDAAMSETELTLRSRGDRLVSTGLSAQIAGGADGIVGLASHLVNAPTWRDAGLARIWQGIDVADLLVGVVRLGRDDPERAIILHLAAGAEGDQRTRFGTDDAHTLAALLASAAQRAITALGSKSDGPAPWLTVREQEVLEHLTVGSSVREIAERLGRSPHTVHDHVKSLHRKLGATSRGALVARTLGFAAAPARRPTVRAVVRPDPAAVANIARGEGAAQPDHAGQQSNRSPFIG